MSYHKRLKKDLAGAAAAGIISPEQADQIWKRSYSERFFASFKAAHWIGAAAGFFVALGLILVVASNWDKIGALTKMGAFLLLFAGAAEACVRLQEKQAAAVPLETLWFFLPVLGIGLYAQIFNLSGDPYKPYLVWGALSAPLALLSRRPLAGFLCSILFFAVLFLGTFSREGMLSLRAGYSNEAGLPAAWHWAVALGALGAGAFLYPGRKLGLPLGAAAVWLFFTLANRTAIHVGSEALLLLAAMSLSALWLTWGEERDDDRSGLPLKVWLAAVYAATFFWHYKAHSYGREADTAAGGAIVWLAFAGAFLSALFRPQRLLPEGKTEDLAAKALLLGSMFCAFLLFGADEASAKVLAVIANVILAAFGVFSILAGTRIGSERRINLGVLVLTLTAVTRFVDVFGGLLASGVGFIFTGLAFAALAYFVNKGRKALIESAKK